MSDVSSEDQNLQEAERLRGLKASLRVGAENLARKKGELDRSIRRFGFLTKVGLLRFRYVCGYLAAGFLISAPMYLSLRFWYQGNLSSELATELFDPVKHSILLGALLLLPFAILAPVTKISWENMRVPEFQKFELSLARSASIVAVGYFVVCLLVTLVADEKEFQYSAFFDPRPAWMNFLLQLVPFLRLKALTMIFSDYYHTAVKKEHLVLRPKSETVRVPTPMGLGQAPSEADEERQSEATQHSEAPEAPSTGAEMEEAPEQGVEPAAPSAEPTRTKQEPPPGPEAAKAETEAAADPEADEAVPAKSGEDAAES